MEEQLRGSLLQIKKKLKSKAGFSLVELLLTTAIMLLVASVVARGIPAAQRVYRRTVDVANAQVLLSTAMIVLRDDVSFATEIKIDDGGEATSGNKITIENPRKGKITLANKMKSVSSKSGETGGTTGGTGSAESTSDVTMAQALMISDGLAGNQGFELQYDTVGISTSDDGNGSTIVKTVAFKGLKVVKEGYKEPLAELKKRNDSGSEDVIYQIRLINPIIRSKPTEG